MKRRTENAEQGLNSFAEGQGVAITLLAFLVFVVLCLRHCQNNAPSPQSSSAPVIVDVQGDVTRPGIYLLKAESASFWDAVEAAGGLSGGNVSDMRQDLLNRTLNTGDLLRVTRTVNSHFDFVLELMPARARLILGQKLDPNRASLEELCLVPQMRPEFAERIVQRRSSKPWRDLVELKEIPGVGPKTIDKWKNHLEIKVRD